MKKLNLTQQKQTNKNKLAKKRTKRKPKPTVLV